MAELTSRSHRPACVRARRLALVAGAWLLRREVREVAATLGISGPAASRLLRGASEVMAEAMAIARDLRAEETGADSQERLVG